MEPIRVLVIGINVEKPEIKQVLPLGSKIRQLLIVDGIPTPPRLQLLHLISFKGDILMFYGNEDAQFCESIPLPNYLDLPPDFVNLTQVTIKYALKNAHGRILVICETPENEYDTLPDSIIKMFDNNLKRSYSFVKISKWAKQEKEKYKKSSIDIKKKQKKK